MKQALHILLILLFSQVSYSQAPEIEWQNTIGGTLNDIPYSILFITTLDGGYFVGGQSNSTNTGDKTEIGNGNNDYWVMKLDMYGVIQWQNTIGGSLEDNLRDVEQTSDGGFIIGGHSSSDITGDKNEISILSDYWVIKLDSIGNIEWQNTITGNFVDQFASIKQTSDNGYILGGYSESSIGADKTEGSIGGSDYWIIKLDSIGTIEWQQTIGGNQDEFLTNVEQLSDGSYIVGGYSLSGISGDKSENNVGGTDFWIIKLDNEGNIVWQQTIGGDLNDELSKISVTNEGGFILLGSSMSGISGDKTESTVGPYGYYDYWVLKLDSVGNIIWQNTIGGDQNDFAKALDQSYDGGVIVGGFSYSAIFGDKTETSFGNSDYWIIKINPEGNIEWENTIGGNSFDNLRSIHQLLDGGFIIAGESSSEISGDKTEGNIGAESFPDFWLIKLLPEECDSMITFYLDEDEDGYGNNLISLLACIPPEGYSLNNSDCNDEDPTIHPFSFEVCNNIDDDCDFNVDEDLPEYVYFVDMDGDGFGNSLISIDTCLAVIPSGYVTNSTDCDDTNTFINVFAIELCNTLDDNCDGEIDEELLVYIYFADIDEDNFGDSLSTIESCLETPPMGYSLNNTDCNDADPDINPITSEICNETDDNCNLVIDEGLTVNDYYIDADGDYYGNPLVSIGTCLGLPPEGYVIDSTDCNDNNEFIYPGSEEFDNGIDDNCNNIVDEGFNSIIEQNIFELLIFPNPNDGDFSVLYRDKNIKSIEIEISNMIGELIFSTHVISGSVSPIHLPATFSGIAIISLKNIPFHYDKMFFVR